MADTFDQSLDQLEALVQDMLDQMHVELTNADQNAGSFRRIEALHVQLSAWWDSISRLRQDRLEALAALDLIGEQLGPRSLPDAELVQLGQQIAEDAKAFRSDLTKQVRPSGRPLPGSLSRKPTTPGKPTTPATPGRVSRETSRGR